MVSRFMDNNKNDNYYIEKALNEIDVIIKYTAGKTYDEFMSDETIIDATMFRLVQMIENIKNISSEFKEQHAQIPWGDIVGFRNGIVHDYGETDYTVVYDIVTKDIYDLKILFEETLG